MSEHNLKFTNTFFSLALCFLGIVRMDSGTLALLLSVVVQWQVCYVMKSGFFFLENMKLDNRFVKFFWYSNSNNVHTVFLSKLCASENRYCQEAVDSVVIVDSCPTSKTEWDNAALRKNCNRTASKQNCGPVDQFVYHCVINGYRNETLEVCAPSRIIFGN